MTEELLATGDAVQDTCKVVDGDEVEDERQALVAVVVCSADRGDPLGVEYIEKYATDEVVFMLSNICESARGHARCAVYTDSEVAASSLC